MTIERDQALKVRIADRLAEAALVKVRPQIPSQTLQGALSIVGVASSSTDRVERRVSLPHYWAIYVHDGRGPFNMPAGRFMCWFRDKNDDPRLAGGYPVRVADQRHLTREEFKHFMLLNRVVERAVYGRLRRPGEPQVGPMIVTNKIKNRTAASLFFDNSRGMAGFAQEANTIGEAAFASFIREELKDVLSLKITTKISLG